MNGAYVRINGYEFVELGLSVFVGINSEKIPENVIQLSLSILVENFNNKSFEILFSQVSLASRVIMIKVNLQFAPDQVNELPFFVTNVIWLDIIFLRDWRQRLDLKFFKPVA